jgi:Fe(II)/alpha-ketoglutarate-dependent arginine beta-hydroxylase
LARHRYQKTRQNVGKVMSRTSDPVTLDISVPPVERFTISSPDARALADLARDVRAGRPEVLREEDLLDLALAARDLPRPLWERLRRFRYETTGGLVLSGLPVDEHLIDTPTNLAERTPTAAELHVETMLLLLASVLGDPFSHEEVQNGRLILDILPVPGDESTQLGSSSSGKLEWHTEDAWHDFRADWFMLFCLRNPQRAATTFGRVEDALRAVDAEKRPVMFAPHFRLKPDSSHAQPAADAKSKRIALLSGDRRAPFVRMDPAFMDFDAPADDADAEPPRDILRRAFEDLRQAFERVLTDVVLQPGDVLLVDNKRAIHGRKPFTANFDGKDRWLRLVNITADLRKSEGHRVGPHGRALRETDAVIG